MRPLLALPALALLALPACLPTEPATPPVTCNEAALSAEFVGRDASVLYATTFTNPVRIIRPGDVVTMDFNPNRINFELDARDRVARVTCG